jgi:hypothetical protein
MLFYVQMKKDIIHPVVIKGDEKEIFSEYKYLGVYLITNQLGLTM